MQLIYDRGFRAALVARLMRGSHLILHGPRGSGKSTLLASLRDYCHAHSIPCGISPETVGLPDVISALSKAFPQTDISGLGRRSAGIRLRASADDSSAILLLDHTREVTTAMIGYLRRLRGGIAGALLVVDTDSEFERERLREWRRHAMCVRMPLAPNRGLRRMIAAARPASDRHNVDKASLKQIIGAARGRVGWLCECVRLMDRPKYWAGDRFHVGALCIDTELAIREGRRGPRMRRR